jgi:hypothetical protein
MRGVNAFQHASPDSDGTLDFLERWRQRTNALPPLLPGTYLI